MLPAMYLLASIGKKHRTSEIKAAICEIAVQYKAEPKELIEAVLKQFPELDPNPTLINPKCTMEQLDSTNSIFSAVEYFFADLLE